MAALVASQKTQAVCQDCGVLLFMILKEKGKKQFLSQTLADLPYI